MKRSLERVNWDVELRLLLCMTAARTTLVSAMEGEVCVCGSALKLPPVCPFCIMLLFIALFTCMARGRHAGRAVWTGSADETSVSTFWPHRLLWSSCCYISFSCWVGPWVQGWQRYSKCVYTGPVPHGNWNARLPLFLETVDPLFWFSGWIGEWWGAYLNLRAGIFISHVNGYFPRLLTPTPTRPHSEGETNSKERIIQCEIARPLFIEHFHLKTDDRVLWKQGEQGRGGKVEDIFKRNMLKITSNRNLSLSVDKGNESLKDVNV